MKTLKIYVINVIAIVLLGAANRQGDCKVIHDGKYYFYPSASKKKYLVIRTGPIQREVELNTTDTSYWRVQWRTNCSFILEFDHRINTITEQERTFFTSHKVVINILNVTKDNYTIMGGIDSVSVNAPIDTLWMAKK